MAETIDLPRLITLLLSTPGSGASDLRQLYLKPVSNPEPELPLGSQTEDELDELMSMLGYEPASTKPPSKPSRNSLESEFEEKSGDGGGKSGGKGKGRGTDSPQRECEEDSGDEVGYGGGLPSDLDATAGFSLEDLFFFPFLPLFFTHFSESHQFFSSASIFIISCQRVETKAGCSRRFWSNPKSDFSGDFHLVSREIKQERRLT